MMKKVLFVGSECYPFIKTGGLADVMYALPKALLKENLDVRVIMPKYNCIPQKYKDNMKYITHFYMDCGKNPEHKYVGILEYQMDGVTYYFIDNEQYFSKGNPYTSIAGDIERFVFFDKAVLAALPVIGFEPDIIHCHDWQAGMVPVCSLSFVAITVLMEYRAVLEWIHKEDWVALMDIVPSTFPMLCGYVTLMLLANSILLFKAKSDNKEKNS